MTRNVPDPSKFNTAIELPFQLCVEDIRSAMQDVYDFFFDVNAHLTGKHLDRLDDMLRKANMSGMLSDMLTASLARHSRSLVVNEYHNGHPDLIVRGQYPNNRERAGEHGVEVKTTLKSGGAVDTHGARNQWLCIRLFARRRDRAGDRPQADVVHRGLPGPGSDRGLPTQRARNLGHPNRNVACRGHCEAPKKLGLPGSIGVDA